MTDEPMFKDVKVGDRCYMYGCGESDSNGQNGTVIHIDPNCYYPVTVRGDDTQVESYTYSGRDSISCELPVLFWSKPNIIPQPRQKKKVMKRKKVYVHFYKDRDGLIDSVMDDHNIPFMDNTMGEPILVESPEYEAEE